MKIQSPQIIKAKDFKIGDVVRLLQYVNRETNNPYYNSEPFQDFTVVKIEKNEITFARPHVVFNEYGSFSIATEIFTAYVESANEYILLDNRFSENVGAKMLDEIREKHFRYITNFTKNPHSYLEEIGKILKDGPTKTCQHFGVFRGESCSVCNEIVK